MAGHYALEIQDDRSVYTLSGDLDPLVTKALWRSVLRDFEPCERLLIDLRRLRSCHHDARPILLEVHRIWAERADQVAYLATDPKIRGLSLWLVRTAGDNDTKNLGSETQLEEWMGRGDRRSSPILSMPSAPEPPPPPEVPEVPEVPPPVSSPLSSPLAPLTRPQAPPPLPSQTPLTRPQAPPPLRSQPLTRLQAPPPLPSQPLTRPQAPPPLRSQPLTRPQAPPPLRSQAHTSSTDTSSGQTARWAMQIVLGLRPPWFDELVRIHGFPGLKRWSDAVQVAVETLTEHHGELLAQVLLGLGALWNGCLYCSRGHLLAANLLYFESTRHLFPLCEDEVTRWHDSSEDAVLSEIEQRLESDELRSMAELVLLQGRIKLGRVAVGGDDATAHALVQAESAWTLINGCGRPPESAQVPPLHPRLSRDWQIQTAYRQARRQSGVNRLPAIDGQGPGRGRSLPS